MAVDVVQHQQRTLAGRQRLERSQDCGAAWVLGPVVRERRVVHHTR